MADSDVLAMVNLQLRQQSSDEEEENDVEPESDGRVASVAAGSMIDALIFYFEQNKLSTADDTHQLSIIKHHVDFMCVLSQKQSSICEFLK